MGAELTSGVEVSVKMSSPPRMTPPAPKSEDDQQSFIAETSLPDTVVTVSADGNELEVAGSTGSSSSNSALPTNNEDDASSVSSINNVINTNISSAPKTYANLFKVPSAPIASKPGPVPSGNKFPPGPPPSSTANKGANGPRAGSPGNSQFVRNYKKQAYFINLNYGRFLVRRTIILYFVSLSTLTTTRHLHHKFLPSLVALV